MKIRIFSLIFSLVLMNNGLNAQELTVKTAAQNFSQATSITRESIEYQYFFDSVAVKKNQNNENLNVEKIGNYLFEYEADQLNLVVNQLAQQERYIVVIGAGEVGFNLAKSLSKEDHDITVIDISPDRCNRVKNAIDAKVIEGNGSSQRTLQKIDMQNVDQKNNPIDKENQKNNEWNDFSDNRLSPLIS